MTVSRTATQNHRVVSTDAAVSVVASALSLVPFC